MDVKISKIIQLYKLYKLEILNLSGTNISDISMLENIFLFNRLDYSLDLFNCVKVIITFITKMMLKFSWFYILILVFTTIANYIFLSHKTRPVYIISVIFEGNVTTS